MVPEEVVTEVEVDPVEEETVSNVESLVTGQEIVPLVEETATVAVAPEVMEVGTDMGLPIEEEVEEDMTAMGKADLVEVPIAVKVEEREVDHTRDAGGIETTEIAEIVETTGTQEIRGRTEKEEIVVEIRVLI